MNTSISHEESLVERTEILFPSSVLIDTEPMYSNFTAIQNALRHREEQSYHRVSSFFSAVFKINMNKFIDQHTFLGDLSTKSFG